MKENKFQSDLIKELKDRFPGCYVLKSDANQIQGMPDLVILYKDKWASLECKRSKNSSKRPNQEYRVNELNKMSYSSFIFPENKEEILNELQRSFES